MALCQYYGARDGEDGDDTNGHHDPAIERP